MAGLKREDFRIEEGRVPVEINGFAEIRKKIAVAGPVHRRLFALFFNVGNPRPDLDKAVDMFFEKIFKPGDRLMVMTNRFSIADHVVTDPARERETIRGILLAETRDFASRLVQLEQNLQSADRPASTSRSVPMKTRKRCRWPGVLAFQRICNAIKRVLNVLKAEFLRPVPAVFRRIQGGVPDLCARSSTPAWPSI